MRKWILFSASLILVAVLCFGLGRASAPTPGPSSEATLACLMSQMKNGDSLVIDEHEFRKDTSTTGEYQHGANRTVDAKDHTVLQRAWSWAGLGGPEAAAMHQGIQVDDNGNVSLGVNKGYGVLEQFWQWLKHVLALFFWVIILGLLVLIVLYAIPGTRFIASAVFRGLAALVPLVGSAVEAVRAKIAFQTPLNQVVDGGEIFKTEIANLPERTEDQVGNNYTTTQKTQIKTMFQDAHGVAQTGTTPATVKAYTG